MLLQVQTNANEGQPAWVFANNQLCQVQVVPGGITVTESKDSISITNTISPAAPDGTTVYPDSQIDASPIDLLNRVIAAAGLSASVVAVAVAASTTTAPVAAPPPANS